MMAKTITVDGVDYVPAPALDANWVMVRSRDAGVFAGELQARDRDVVELSNARRIWYWDGAATLSDLATAGPSRPDNCKFPVAVPAITVLGVCEVIPMTTAAVDAIAAVPVWSEQ